MDTAKARRELGWEPRFDAAETLLQTAIAAREAGLLRLAGLHGAVQATIVSAPGLGRAASTSVRSPM